MTWQVGDVTPRDGQSLVWYRSLEEVLNNIQRWMQYAIFSVGEAQVSSWSFGLTTA